MDKRAGPVAEISLEEAISRLPGWKYLHINIYKRASPVAGMEVQRYGRKLFLTYCQNNLKITKLPRQAG
jgi:hypothetical protein